MRIELKNECLTAQIDTHGAELKSIRRNDREYLWHGDPAYWNRTSPILFPLVGALSGGTYRYDGKEYPMSQHGFARDMEFTLQKQELDCAVFLLSASEKTREIYPFEFELAVTYTLKNDQLSVLWTVKNNDTKKMYFSIGAHPAFLCKLDEQGTIGGNYLKFNTKGEMTATEFADGLVQPKTHPVQLDQDGCLQLDAHTFDNGVLIFEDHQATQVSLADSGKKPYVTLDFDTPLFGVWAPEKKNAPFVCIEPWYGRADEAGFDGELSARKYEQELEAGGVFSKGYQMTFPS